MACEACYTIIEALNQANKNTKDFQEIANRYRSLYEASQKDCDAMAKMVQIFVEKLDIYLRNKQ